MASRFLFLFVLTLAFLAAARPSDSELSSEVKGSSYWDSSFMLDDQRFTDGQLEQGRSFFSTESQWPYGKVYYVIDPSLADCIAIIQAAIDHITYKTGRCITFYPRTAEKDYIRFYKGTGCWSLIGKKGGSQDISLGDGCCYLNIAIHEILHALGFYHEQQHPDRDKWIIIYWNNIPDQWRSQFDYITTPYDDYWEFDYHSLMLYGKWAFSSNGNATMAPKDPNVVWEEHTTKDGMSAGDCKMVKKHYCCSFMGLVDFPCT